MREARSLIRERLSQSQIIERRRLAASFASSAEINYRRNRWTRIFADNWKQIELDQTKSKTKSKTEEF